MLGHPDHLQSENNSKLQNRHKAQTKNKVESSFDSPGGVNIGNDSILNVTTPGVPKASIDATAMLKMSNPDTVDLYQEWSSQYTRGLRGTTHKVASLQKSYGHKVASPQERVGQNGVSLQSNGGGNDKKSNGDDDKKSGDDGNDKSNG